MSPIKRDIRTCLAKLLWSLELRILSWGQEKNQHVKTESYSSYEKSGSYSSLSPASSTNAQWGRTYPWALTLELTSWSYPASLCGWKWCRVDSEIVLEKPPISAFLPCPCHHHELIIPWLIQAGRFANVSWTLTRQAMWDRKVALVAQQWSNIQFTDGNSILNAEECHFSNSAPGDTCLSLGVNGLQENPVNKWQKVFH